MNRIIVTAILFILLPRFAAAQKPDHPPRGLGYGFVGAGTAGMGLNSGIGGELGIANGFGVGAEVGGIGLTAQDDNKVTGVGSLDLIYHHFPKKLRGNAAPFLTGGYATFFGHNTHTEFGGGGAYHTHGFNLGGGVDLFATSHLGVRLDLRYYGHGGRILNWVYPNVQQFSFVAFRIGMTFR
jgi:opacity protein-like surface antigen